MSNSPEVRSLQYNYGISQIPEVRNQLFLPYDFGSNIGTEAAKELNKCDLNFGPIFHSYHLEIVQTLFHNS